MLSAMSDLAVRPALPVDAEGIARAFLESAGRHAEIDPERYAVPELPAIVGRYRSGRQHPQDAIAITFVADSSGEVVGFVDARLERPQDAMHRACIYCLIAEIAVLSSWRRKGIGELLLRAAENWGASQGAEFAFLEYLPANTSAAAFYRERMGYRVAAITAVKRLSR